MVTHTNSWPNSMSLRLHMIVNSVLRTWRIYCDLNLYALLMGLVFSSESDKITN